MPCEKIAHPSEKAAKSAIRRLQRARKDKKHGRLHAYKCPSCRLWHIGHTTWR